MSGSVVPWRWKKKKVPVGGERDSLAALQRQVNRLFNQVVAGSAMLPDFVSEPLAQLGEQLTTFHPNVNVERSVDSIIVSVELPGMDERDVELSLTSDGLTIRGERKPHGLLVGEDSWSYSESTYGAFERVVPLGGLRVLEEGVEATASKGIVTIVLPLQAPMDAPAKKVEIRPGG